VIKRELAIFLVIGGLTVVVDFVIYQGLVFVHLLNVDWSKGVGFLTGTVFAYFANRFWTFGHKRYHSGSVWRFAVLYASTLAVNVWVNAVTLGALNDLTVSVLLAFLLATGVSATLNFLGMKFFVFKC